MVKKLRIAERGDAVGEDPRAAALVSFVETRRRRMEQRAESEPDMPKKRDVDVGYE